MIEISYFKWIPKATESTMIDIVRIFRPSWRFLSLAVYGGNIDSTISQRCINFGYFRAKRMKFNTPYAVVEKNANGTRIESDKSDENEYDNWRLIWFIRRKEPI